ncbi:hypothetical protein [Hymenobacter nivis]|uniref:hypothetical protein n=1 Tax=Hymenobacter nivis TaxID=1850093 RepID=UPI00112A5553|nr:hypothetical protein [Hymenobacter nivis]
MAETLVRFRQWLFSVDKEATETTYAASLASVPTACGCHDCLNFEAARELAFPPEALALFTELGVDYRREGEVFQYQRLPDGRHHYGGWLHFRGAILDGPDFFSTAENKIASLTDLFSIGFTAGNAPSIFPNLHHIVQIEIETYIPWLLTDVPEPD